MNHELNLSFFIKKCFFEIENTDELTPDGKKILDLEIKPNGPSFEEYKQLLKENLSVFYLPGNIYELEDIFVDPDEELEIESYDIDRIYPLDKNTLCFSISGTFKILVNKPINSDEDLRSIEEELDGNFDNGVQVDFNFFDFDKFEEPNGGSISFTDHEGLGVSFLNK